MIIIIGILILSKKKLDEYLEIVSLTIKNINL